VKKIQPKRSSEKKTHSSEQAGRGNSKPRPSQSKDRDGSRSPSAGKGPKPQRAQSERDGIKPKRAQSERDGIKPKRAQPERDGIKPKRAQSERDGIKPKRAQPERDGIKPKRAQSERDGIKPKRAQPERDGIKPKRAQSERDGIKPKRAQPERDGIKPKRAQPELDGAKPQQAQSEYDDSKPKRPQTEREGPKGRRSHQTGRQGLFINNWSALEEYLRAQPASLNKIFHAPRETKRLREMLDKYGVTLACEEDKDMETGIAASISLSFKSEEQLLSEAVNRSEDLIIACDHVTDTRNLGAIARTAAFFGVSTLIMPKDRQAPITSATLGTAQGAFATVSPTEVTNLGRTLMALKDSGYWIAAADMVGTSVDKMPTRYEKLVLVLGSEDKGVAAQILNKSDFTLSIPSFGGKLESLNVSVAAGILIHALRAQSAQGKILPEG